MKNDPRNAQGWIICPPHDFASDDCPPVQHSGRNSDPHNPPEPRYKPDPRPPMPCMNKGCFACKPGPLPKKPMVANLKLRQLADCYACRVSDGAHNRRKMFYERWQTFLDRLPKRYPNMDYTVYSCNDYVDMGVNNDFVKYDSNLPLRKGPRQYALENFLWTKNLAEANAEVKKHSYECVPHVPYCYYNSPSKNDTVGVAEEKRFRLYLEDGITRWNEIMLQPEPKGYVEAGTIYKSRLRPFVKDVSFTTPVDIPTGFATGNEPPFKELRDLKKAM